MGFIMSQSENPSSNQSSETTKSSETAITLCAGGCGFYGSVEMKNYCSQCFKKRFPEEANSKSSNNTNKNKKEIETCVKVDEPKKKVQKKRNRCWQCRKKMTLAGQFECKCGYVYCGKHRYPDSHNCDFDHKKIHQAKLAKDNKTIAPSKLDKI